MADSIVSTSPGIGKLNWADFAKGFLVAVISAVLTTVETSLSAGSLTFDWKAIGIIAATTGVSYLIKNLLTPATTTISNTGTSVGDKVSLTIPAPGLKTSL